LSLGALCAKSRDVLELAMLATLHERALRDRRETLGAGCGGRICAWDERVARAAKPCGPGAGIKPRV